VSVDSASTSRDRRRGPLATAASSAFRTSSPRSSSGIAFEARNDEHRKRSGVSQRIADQRDGKRRLQRRARAIVTGDAEIRPRISDITPRCRAITDKIELEYEESSVGGPAIARELIRRAPSTFMTCGRRPTLTDIIMWFDEGAAEVADEARADVALQGFEKVPRYCCASFTTQGSRRRRCAPSPWRRADGARGARRSEEDLALRRRTVWPRQSGTAPSTKFKTCSAADSRDA